MKQIGTLSYAHLLGDWLVELGYTHCFFVAGGGCMHLIEGFRTRFACIPVVHEMSAGITAEHFNECSPDKKAFALVTTGPGLTNIVTAIAGCYTERRPLLVIAGQVKTTDVITPGLRQRGVQEIDGRAIMRDITVKSVCLTHPIKRAEFREVVETTERPHPGPVLVEVCLDVQGATVSRAALEDVGIESALTPVSVESAPKDLLADQIAALRRTVSDAKRPVFLIGGLVSRKVAWSLTAAFERLGIPVMTATSAIDRIPTSSPVYAGRPGSWGGQRSANMLIAQSDVLVGIGVQWDLQQTGFNWAEYAPGAAIHQVYPCTLELAKGHPRLAGAINGNPDAVLNALLDGLVWQDTSGWADYMREVRTLLPILEPANTVRDGYLSSFEIMHNLSRAATADDVIALCSSGGTFTGGLQVIDIAAGQYATTSPAFASMGYGLATAIGAAFARPGQRVITLEGDGGFSQNLQELSIIGVNNLPVKMFLFDNGGYGSIRATQKKFFNGGYAGCDAKTGLGFPDWVQLFGAYGIKATCLTPADCSVDGLVRAMAAPGPEAFIVPIDPEQPNWPAVSSRILPDGKMASNPLYNMLPALDAALAERVSRYLPVTG